MGLLTLMLRLVFFGLCMICMIGSWLSGGQSFASQEQVSPTVESAQTTAPSRDPFTLLGLTVTRGAAPGYVEDRVCEICHRTIYESYQEVGMAKSFFRPRSERVIEDFKNNHFFIHRHSDIIK